MTGFPAGYRLSFDPADADPAAAHAFLTRSYWASGIEFGKVARAMANSLCGCLIHETQGQVGMARVISDFATFAYVADVYVLEEHRGRRLAYAMMEALKAHPSLQGLRRWILFTQDAHSLYELSGFTMLPYPERAMLLDFPDAYA